METYFSTEEYKSQLAITFVKGKKLFSQKKTTFINKCIIFARLHIMVITNIFENVMFELPETRSTTYIATQPQHKSTKCQPFTVYIGQRTKYKSKP